MTAPNYQTNYNKSAAFKVQSGLGSPASGSGGTLLRLAGGTPAKLSKTAIPSKEVRRDAQPTRGRHGMQASAGGPYTLEASVGSTDEVFQALLRGSWDSAINATSSDFTSCTISGGHTVTWLSGNPITKGFRVGDVCDITGAADSANNSKNLRLTGLTASTMVFAEALTNDASPDTGLTITRRGRKVIMPAAPVERFFTIEEYEGELDAGRLFQDCLWKTGKWAMAPNGLLTFEPSWVGTGSMAINQSTDAPVLTSPTLPSGAPLAVLDAILRVGGSDAIDLTSFDLTLDNGAVAPAVAASKVSPTVRGGLNQVSMNLKFLRKDVTFDLDFLNETSLSLQVLALANMSEPKDFIAINVPFFTLGSADPSAISTAGGAAEVTISVPPALVGHDTTGSGYDDTAMSIQISNAS